MDFRSTTILTAAVLEQISENSALAGTHVTTFGRSLMGHPLRLFTVGQGRPLILLVATHHAMEWICGWVLLDFLQAHREATAVNKAPRGTFCVVPLLNPDGVELVAGGWRAGDILAPRQRRANGGSVDFSHWQANGRGVDLNHNYPVGYDAYRAVEADMGIWEGAPTRYSGTSPFSEPETQALGGLIELLAPDVTLALHTQGEELFSGSAEGDGWMLAHLLARRLGYRHAVPAGAAAYGGLTDWLTARGMYAMTLECGRGHNPLPPTVRPTLSARLVPALLCVPEMYQYVNNL